MFSDRKVSFKTPPAALVDVRQSQSARREKALEEQKRRRAQRIDASRQLDLFADLTLGPSDDEGEDEGDGEPIREGVASFASMLPESSVGPSTSQPASEEASKKGGKKKTKKRRKHKANKWAEKCMYAELLEMTEDNPWSDGLPTDLETGWVAVAPVPVGKRCLAVTHHSFGFPSAGPNTTLHSRLLGKCLLPPFPSALPPSTILDCILDPNWAKNGILHVLDVIQWKGQEVGDCETAFRFWWRDTRLSELPPTPPPPSAPSPENTAPTSYRFPYPTNLVPVPYHTDTSLTSLLTSIIPSARVPRYLSIFLPAARSFTMDIDTQFGSNNATQPVTFEIAPDGLLLYVVQASYEPGTSPLSSWVPVHAYDGGGEGHLDVFERLVRRRFSRPASVEVDMDAD
ncbi:hypothetical protein NEOLEDRAFT_1119107 [Neolentinus lepideus HHB14362 ss-1]|uniref:Snurportin-1 n=1 Tax=Neolentinus lepideus HHB14362 ss-1 TaxID=1314782 RepID=A0A165QRC5_9AGAM|nr:hypothetical protein NEOLEDRAFT_1119107 [Neolentinus lepideus HHB14362 ss-1]